MKTATDVKLKRSRRRLRRLVVPTMDNLIRAYRVWQTRLKSLRETLARNNPVMEFGKIERQQRSKEIAESKFFELMENAASRHND
jgi:hypothetical protein